MRRRDLLLASGAALVVSPRAVAQRPAGPPRVAVLSAQESDEPPGLLRTPFEQALREHGWKPGADIVVEYVYAEGRMDRLPAVATELASAKPDVIVARGSGVTGVLKQHAGAIPVVFILVADPVGQMLVTSLADPGGTMTGFTNYDYSIAGKWLQTLKEIAPGTARIAVLFDPRVTAGGGWPFYRAVESAAPSVHVETGPAPVQSGDDIEDAVASVARGRNGGLLVLPDAFTATRSTQIIALAARHRIPAIYPMGFFAARGGLASYGVDIPDQVRQAAGYVDRILKGAKPGELPVQTPTRFELVINLRTAKTLGIEIPQSLLARADEVIE